MSEGGGFDETLRACEGLLAILKRLRAPDGCPWDRKQTEETMAPLILEEAFELADAVADGRPDKAAEEMGDLFMNVFMTGLIAEEGGRFTLKQVFERIASKLVNRHPHVFGDETRDSVDAVLHRWEDIKRGEREASNEDASAVAGVPRAMPGLLRAFRVAEKLRRTGANLPPFRDPLERAAASLDRLRGMKPDSLPREVMAGTVGELFLELCNAAAILGVNPEMALRSAVTHEEEAFRRTEAALGRRLEDAPAEEIDRCWEEKPPES
jgi:MazG family protein